MVHLLRIDSPIEQHETTPKECIRNSQFAIQPLFHYNNKYAFDFPHE